MTLVALWLAFFGVWPLAHPQHDTFADPMTWADLTLHAAGLLLVWRSERHRLRLAWFVYRHGLPATVEYPDGSRYEWKEQG